MILQNFKNILPYTIAQLMYLCFLQSDVSGNCEAEYTVDTLGFHTVTLKKSKNLLGCTDRTGHFTSLQANTYNVPSIIHCF